MPYHTIPHHAIPYHTTPYIPTVCHPIPHQADSADGIGGSGGGSVTTGALEEGTQLVVTAPEWVRFGPGSSSYSSRFLAPDFEQHLLRFCRDQVRYQIYQCKKQGRPKGHTGGVPRFLAPKAEFYLLDNEGRRPHYKWVQINEFNHAGQPMPPILQRLCEQLNTYFHLMGDDRFNHCLIICNEQSGNGPDAHCAPAHADKIQKGFFVDLSLGYEREMQLLDVNTKKVVATQLLASGSLAHITAQDNGRLGQGNGPWGLRGTRYMHAVPVDPDQPDDQPRFSIVFRPITDHPKGDKNGEHLALVDEAQAARLQPGGDLWREYVPLYRR